MESRGFSPGLFPDGRNRAIFTARESQSTESASPPGRFVCHSRRESAVVLAVAVVFAFVFAVAFVFTVAVAVAIACSLFVIPEGNLLLPSRREQEADAGIVLPYRREQGALAP